MNTFITLTELGEIYGVSAREVGRWLKGLRLREEDGQPSRAAHDQRLVLERELRHGGYFYLWHKDKTCALLDGMQYPRGSSLPVDETHDGFVIIRGGK